MHLLSGMSAHKEAGLLTGEGEMDFFEEHGRAPGERGVCPASAGDDDSRRRSQPVVREVQRLFEIITGTATFARAKM